MKIISDIWLEQFFDRPCYVLSDVQEKDPIEDLSLSVYKHFYTARVPTSQVDVLDRLMSQGFRLIGTQILFRRTVKYGEEWPAPTEDVQIKYYLVGVNAQDDWAHIAATAFCYDRFHMDPEITCADAIKTEWALNYQRGQRGKELFLAFHKDTVCGFLGVCYTSLEDRPTIDLIAVHPDYQRQGIGRLLVTGFLQCHQGRTCQVSTQVVNLPSLRLYQSVGFLPAESHYVLHAYRKTVDFLEE